MSSDVISPLFFEGAVDLDQNTILRVVMYMVPVILSITVHEYAHAFASYKLGDDTAALSGRLTLNPIAHIDLLGTVIIPIISIVYEVPFFGWAKPVPFNPQRFTRALRMKTSTLIVALAGPASNLLFAFLMVIVGRVLFGGQGIDAASGSPVFTLLNLIMTVNVALAFFNILPVPPLDGSKILYGILPDRFFGVIEFLERYSFVLFIVIILFGARVVAVPITIVLALFYALMGL
ncbi:MAG: site-2 protease family protein [Deltaproteobacteria bacterium]|nr:site-2 protease family protein [Deltaproteobacteria bacterium]